MKRRIGLVLLVALALGFVVPESRVIPVRDATPTDWNKDTFWFEPWGSSGVHKGIDIFASTGTDALASTDLLILTRTQLAKGGNVIVALGPKWRIHYFAHLESIDENAGYWVNAGDKIGTVGDTGNAKGKPPHMHYSIVSLLPMIWKIDTETQGYKKAFYLDPIAYFNDK